MGPAAIPIQRRTHQPRQDLRSPRLKPFSRGRDPDAAAGRSTRDSRAAPALNVAERLR